MTEEIPKRQPGHQPERSRTVKIESDDETKSYYPDEYHFETPQVITMIWYGENGELISKIQVPTQRLVNVVVNTDGEDRGSLQ
jgi:hypothetical protein